MSDDASEPWAQLSEVHGRIAAPEQEALVDFLRANGEKKPDLAECDLKVQLDGPHVTGLFARFSGKVRLVPESIGALSELKKLWLERYALKDFPVGVAHVKKLESLTLKDNSISSIPDSLVLKSLVSINLSENKFKQWPAVFAKWPALEEVRLAKNELRELPVNLDALKQLRTLNVEGNKLKALPESMTKLKALESLIVSDNALTVLPAQLGELKALRRLGASRNKLKVLPASLAQCTKLEALFLSKNALTELPDLSQLEALTKLVISDNKLKALDPALRREGLELKAENNPLSGYLPVAKLKSMVSGEPWKALQNAEAALAGNHADAAGYRGVALKAVRSILSDFDEHGDANKGLYGNKPASFFKKRLEAFEEGQRVK